MLQKNILNIYVFIGILKYSLLSMSDLCFDGTESHNTFVKRRFLCFSEKHFALLHNLMAHFFFIVHI